MFVSALEAANGFVFPYVGLRHRSDGTTSSTLAAFVVVNGSGWALTAGHVLAEIMQAREESEHPPSGGGAWVSHRAEIWALPGFEAVRSQLAEAVVDVARDLALVRLEPFNAEWVPKPPRFRSAEHPISPGLAVCRLGFPFYDVSAEYVVATDEFSLAPGAFPVPRFALDGIVSRFRNQVAEDGRSATFIETSTPGLRGQSGGPLLDVDGRICGIQSHTVHLDLGFDARYERDGVPVVERQFLNSGAAVHVGDVMAFLAEHDIEFEIA